MLERATKVKINEPAREAAQHCINLYKHGKPPCSDELDSLTKLFCALNTGCEITELTPAIGFIAPSSDEYEDEGQ